MTDLILHGIKACDTMKKARSWLDSHALAYRFHHYKIAGAARRIAVVPQASRISFDFLEHAVFRLKRSWSF